MSRIADAIEACRGIDRCHRRLGVGDEEPGGAVVDQLAHRAPIVGDHRGAACHGLDHAVAERFVEVDQVEQRMGTSEHLRSLCDRHGPEVSNAARRRRAARSPRGSTARPARCRRCRAGGRFDGRCRSRARCPCRDGSARRTAGGLRGRDATANEAGVDAVVDRRRVVELRMPVGVADRDVVGGRVVPLVHRHDARRREPVDRRDHRCVDEAAVGEREEVEAVVDDVEVVGTLEHRGDVQALGDLRLDRGILGPPGRCRAVQRGGGDRVGGGEQRHVVPRGDQPLGEQRCELFPRAVVARRRPPGDRSEHRDPQW